MDKPHIYLASGWFNEEQKDQMTEVYRVLLDLKMKDEIDFFAPFYDGIVLKGKSDPDWREKMKAVWELDIKKLSESQLVVVCTQDHDVGSIFEAGYASALHIPILCYNSKPELGLNVMLSQEAKGFVKTPADLEKAIRSFLENREDKTWCWNLFNGEPI